MTFPGGDHVQYPSYDNAGHLLQRVDGRGVITNYSYTYGFGYDGAGNPTTFKGVGHTFNSNNQDSGNTYDNEGNPTTYKGTAMTWDAEDRLTGVGSTWTAGYQFTGLRAWKNNAGTKTYFLYDGTTPVVELDASGNVLAANTFGAAGLLARRASGSTSFYTFDLQGNVAQRLGSTGGVQASFNYDAYGVGHVTTVADCFGFGSQAGYYTDLETGLQAMAFRYYDAGAGRWLNRDPISYAGGINLYGYCANGPVGALDPAGTQGEEVVIGILGGGLAIPGVGEVEGAGLIIIGVGAGITIGGKALIDWINSRPWERPCQFADEHTKGARPSTREKHEKGRATKKRDRGGERGDNRRWTNKKRSGDPSMPKGGWPKGNQ